MRHDLISGDQRRTAMRPFHSDLTLVMSTAGQAINALPLTRRPAFDAPTRRPSRTVPRWPSLVIGHYRRYARPKCNCVTWSGLPASCPRCSSLGIMSLALPARNHVCRSVAQRQLFSDKCVAASCITPKVAVRLITSTPDPRAAQGSTLSPASPDLGLDLGCHRPVTPTKPKTFAALASDERIFAETKADSRARLRFLGLPPKNHEPGAAGLSARSWAI